MDNKRKLEIANARSVMDNPFLGHLILSMPLVKNDDIPTFATDGRSIFYNDEFLSQISMDELQFVLMHEVMHPAFFHLTRIGNRNPTLWNMAGDYIINYQLVKQGLTPPSDILLDDKYDDSWNTDQVYNDLIDNGCEKIQSLDDMPSTGYFTEGSDSDSGKSELENEWKTKIISAANSTKQRGNIPAAFKEIIDEIRNPRVDWKDKLYHLATDPMRDEHTWKRPIRKYIADNIYLPSLQKINGLRKIVFAIDTSGSMDSSALADCWSEITSVARDCDVDELIILDVDTQVHNVHRFQASDIPTHIEVVGRGGTAFEPAFDWVIENDEDPSVLIYLTDMYGSFPQYEPDYPVIWVNYGGKSAGYNTPFGEVIDIE